MSSIFSSSVGKKFLMSLAGLFLVLYLIIHLGINILVLLDSPEAFNKAAHFMGTNPVIRAMEFVLFGGFLVHMIYGVIVNIANLLARPVGYKESNKSETSLFSKYMLHTAVVITVFLVLHLIDFWVKVRFIGNIPDVVYDGETYHDLGTLVIARFKLIGVVITYVVGLLFLGFHLHHGFQSAFQTIGLNHPVYTPIIKSIGLIYTLVITLGFIAIPIVVYFFK